MTEKDRSELKDKIRGHKQTKKQMSMQLRFTSLYS